MANEEHLKILKQGVKFWNKWREENPDIKLNLSFTNLNWMILSEVNLSEAILFGSNLQGANMIEANLEGADFSSASISRANLSEANFKGANFSNANLSEANLCEADLRRANLIDANLIGANLSKANLSGANLYRADIIYADLGGANLKNSILNYANCSDSKFTEANLTGISFDRTITFGWKIERVQCKYIYLDVSKENRCPKDRNFKPGEFERLYRSIPTIEFIFDKGMKWIDALVLDWITNKIHNEKPNFGLELLSLDKQGVYPRATFSVASEELKEQAEKEVKSQYARAIQILESQNRYLIDRFFEISMYALQQPRKQIRVAGDYYEIHGNAQINKIKINQAIEDIKQEVEKEPETSFKGKTKKKVIEILDDTLKDVAKGGLKEAGKKIFELAQTELVSLLPKIATQLAVFKMINF